jgi:hypothetical protein
VAVIGVTVAVSITVVPKTEEEFGVDANETEQEV